MQLKITRPGSLLSVIHEQEVTPAQANIIIAIAKAPNLTYGEALAWLANRPRVDYDAPTGAGESVEAFRG